MTLVERFEAVCTEAQKDAVTEYVLGNGTRSLSELLPPDHPPATEEQRDIIAAVIAQACFERRLTFRTAAASGEGSE